MISLKDKVVIITGGGRGIGFGLSTAFAKAGAKLVLTGRTESTLLAAKEKLETAYGCEVLCVTADGADEAAIQNVIDKTVEKFGKIDAVVNNAQASASGKMLIDHSLSFPLSTGTPFAYRRRSRTSPNGLPNPSPLWCGR